MKEITAITKAVFCKDGERIPVKLPHTWNALDGQDGGSDYRRDAFDYELELPEARGHAQYLEIQGANQSAEIYDGETLLARHEGGYSCFRVNITQLLKEGRGSLRVRVDNRPSHIYPQNADFTFFGGLYRDVYFIDCEEVYFDLMRSGSPGVFIRGDGDGVIEASACLAGDLQTADRVELLILDAGGHIVAVAEEEATSEVQFRLKLDQPRLWQGIEDPYLYTARFNLLRGEDAVDQIYQEFGFRSFRVDPEKGFFLNGKAYPLRGVSRHQDRLNKGYALDKEDHEEDLALIAELGANTIRLAHYQHDDYFYRLCDRAGFVVWAEIPFISVFMPGEKSRENTLQQMRELILQNFNHCSICFWGISNEITIGKDSPELRDNLRALNTLCKELDPSRLTTLANVSMVPNDSPHNDLTDVLSYNHYFGWYSGNVQDNAPWLDRFHAENPNRPLGISEYGAEGIVTLHSENPQRRDYSEEYHALYHEKMIECIEERPYLWATHVWNMFDFAADARDEGGVKGRNNKGLVSFDRKTRKDAFYLYKAFWSRETFAHLCSKRFRNRAASAITVKAYSNLPELKLYVNDQFLQSLSAEKIFIFPDVALREGENVIAVEGQDAQGRRYYDEAIFCRVAEEDKSYSLPPDPTVSEVENWFTHLQEATEEGAAAEHPFTLKNTVAELLAHPEAGALIRQFFDTVRQNGGKSMDGMMEMLKNMSLDMILGFGGFREGSPTREYLRKELGKISRKE